jgi:hypothetical protein
MISLPIFIVSLAIGIFMVYITNSPQDVIYVYPTPDNVDKLQYKDKQNNCFEYNATHIKCPKNKEDIQSYVMK